MIFGYNQLWATLFIGCGRILSCSGFINSSPLHYPTKGQILREDNKGSPFLKCVGSIWAIGHCPNRFRPPLPSLCQTGKHGQKCPKPSWQALTPPGNVAKKGPQTILASLYTLPPLTGNAHMETTHFKKGLP